MRQLTDKQIEEALATLQTSVARDKIVSVSK